MTISPEQPPSPAARVRAALGTGRRAAVAVATAANDAPALALLATGAAVAALGWLSARRRRAGRTSR